MMRRTMILAACLAAIAALPQPSAAASADCTMIGNVLHCSDGSRGTMIGNVWRHRDGPATSEKASVEAPPADAKCLKIGDKEFCIYPAKARACRMLDDALVCEPDGERR